jgi:hypothetical protein
MSVWHNRISLTAAAADGANGVNQQWEQRTSTLWYIELQRFGCDDVTAVVYANRLNFLANGKNIFN